jgi:hypothetical protein
VRRRRSTVDGSDERKQEGPAPLLSVASILPSGDNASPNGFGAWTLTSIPAGVTRRPFGRTAARTPSITVLVVAGRSPAGPLLLLE